MPGCACPTRPWPGTRPHLTHTHTHSLSHSHTHSHQCRPPSGGSAGGLVLREREGRGKDRPSSSVLDTSSSTSPPSRPAPSSVRPTLPPGDPTGSARGTASPKPAAKDSRGSLGALNVPVLSDLERHPIPFFGGLAGEDCSLNRPLDHPGFASGGMSTLPHTGIDNNFDTTSVPTPSLSLTHSLTRSSPLGRV
jgi:hypothetical protein